MNEDGLNEIVLLIEVEGKKCVFFVFDFLDCIVLIFVFGKIKDILGFIEIFYNNVGGSLRKDNCVFFNVDIE